MRDLVIYRLIENKKDRAKKVWHWGKDKVTILEISLRVKYNRLSNEELLEQYEELVSEYYI